MRDNRSIGNAPEAANLDLENFTVSGPSSDPDSQEYDALTAGYYSERALIRAELAEADWWQSLTVYLLFIALTLLIY